MQDPENENLIPDPAGRRDHWLDTATGHVFHIGPAAEAPQEQVFELVASEETTSLRKEIDAQREEHTQTVAALQARIETLEGVNTQLKGRITAISNRAQEIERRLEELAANLTSPTGPHIVDAA